MFFKFFDRTSVSFVCVFIYRALLDIVYAGFVSKNYEYEGFYFSFQVAALASSYAGLAICSLALVWAQRRNGASIGNSMLGIVFAFYVVPGTSLWGCREFTLHSAVMLFGFLSICASRKFFDLFVNWRPPVAAWGMGPLYLGLACMSVLSLGLLGISGLLSNINFDLNLVYETRDVFNDQFVGGRIGSYVINWQAKVTNYALVIFGLMARGVWRSLAIVGVFLQLVMFAVSGHKFYLFSLALICAVYFVVHKRGALWKWWPYLAMVAAGVGFVLAANADTELLGSILTRRLFFIPPMVGEMHVEFFSRPWNEYLRLSHSIFGGLTEYPFYDNYLHVISREMMGKVTNANTGIIGDGFDNFGWIGVAIWSVFVGGFLTVCDRATENVDGALANAITVVPAYSFVNSGFLTTLLTHGLLFAVLLAWAVSGAKSRQSNKPQQI